LVSFGDAINDQNSGWGIDFAVNYQITNKWSTCGFYRHWDIEKSETSTGTIAGVVAFTAEEPKIPLMRLAWVSRIGSDALTLWLENGSTSWLFPYKRLSDRYR
jgi:hypothetical protein